MDSTWTEVAACQDKPLEWFFGPTPGAKGGGRATELAFKKGKKVCEGCPVRDECYADAKGQPWGAWGVWGGVMWQDGVPGE